MGNSQSNEAPQTPRKERQTLSDHSSTAPSTIKKRASVRRQHQVLSSSSPPIPRKGSADTTSTADQTDRLSLLDEPGSSVPQSANRSRRDSAATSISGIVEEDESELLPAVNNDDGTVAATTRHETIPMTIRWEGPGAKIYITGSFSHWRKKVPMLKKDGDRDFTATLKLTPGTHRLKFDVDGEWKINDSMPVATDSGGNFVNYVEVQAPDDLSLTREGGHHAASLSDEESTKDDKWTNNIPSFMTPSEELLNSPAMIPPSLPPHLEKVILNTSNERKDDHSVLPHPNHVVLNHLAASSIRNGVLAVSASTRYRRKYVTTILYKPAA